MRIEGYHPPKSSFLSINKDMKLLVDKVLANDRLCNLLYYTSRDALQQKKLTDEQKIAMFGQQIRLVPKLYVDTPVLNYMIISFDNFIESENPEFRDNIIEFDIICHFDQWQLKDFDLRPYRIAAEIDTMLNKQRLTDEFGGICLMYKTYHGGEDKKNMPNPADQEQFNQDYKKMIEQEILNGIKIDE